MAEQMQDIKRRIKSIDSTERITNAMKLVSASKLRRAKNAYEQSQLYLDRLLISLRGTFDNENNIPKDFLVGSREIKKTCYVVISSSTGLCGSYNSNVIKVTEKNMEDENVETCMVTIGSKAREYFDRRGEEILNAHDAPADTVTFQESQDISIPLIEMYEKGEIDEIMLVYTSYINTLKQEPVVERLVPIDIKTEDPKVEKFFTKDIEYDPSTDQLFEYFITKYVELRIYGTSIEAATCEYAARRLAMENANDNAQDMLSMLNVHYNRARQSEITDQIIEIVAGSEAQK